METIAPNATDLTFGDAPCRPPPRAIHFCRATLCKRGLYPHAVSVCPSVRLSVTIVNSVKTSNRIFKIFSPSGSQAILVFPYRMSWQYSDGDHPITGGVGTNRDS